MSTLGMKKRYTSVMERIIKNAVSETTKVLETVIVELKAEVLQLRNENESLQMKCRQFEDVIEKRSIYRDTGTSPDPWIIEKCDKAVQFDFIFELLEDDEPNHSENEAQSESSFGPFYDKGSSSESLSFSKSKDIEDNSWSPLDLSHEAMAGKPVADHGENIRKNPAVSLYNTWGPPAYCQSVSKISDDEDFFLESHDVGQNELDENDSFSLQEDHITVPIEIEAVICETSEAKSLEYEGGLSLVLSPESPRSTCSSQQEIEETTEMDIELDQKTSSFSSEIKTDNLSTEDVENDRQSAPSSSELNTGECSTFEKSEFDNNSEQVEASAEVFSPPRQPVTDSADVTDPSEQPVTLTEDCSVTGPSEQPVTLTEDCSVTGPSEQPVTLTDDCSVTGPSEQPVTLTEDCSVNGPSEQPVTLTDDCSVTGPSEQPVTLTEDCSVNGPSEQPVTLMEDCSVNGPSEQPVTLTEDCSVNGPSEQPVTLAEDCSVNGPSEQPVTLAEGCSVTDPSEQPVTLAEDCSVNGPSEQPVTLTEDCSVTDPSEQPVTLTEDCSVTDPSEQPVTLTEDCSVTDPSEQPVTLTDGCSVTDPSEQPVTLTEDCSVNKGPLESEHTSEELDGIAVRSESPESIRATTAQHISPKSQYFLRRQRRTSVTLEDAMLLLDAVSQQKYKTSPKKSLVRDSVKKKVASLNLVDIPEIDAPLARVSDKTEETEHATRSLVTQATLGDDSVDASDAVSPDNIDIADQQLHQKVVGQGLPLSPPEAIRLNIKENHPNLLCPPSESQATLITDNAAPHQTQKELAETLQSAHPNTADITIETHNNQANAPASQSPVESPIVAGVCQVTKAKRAGKTPKRGKRLRRVPSDNIESPRLDPNRSRVVQTALVRIEHPTLKENEAVAVNLTPPVSLSFEALAQTTSSPNLQTSVETTGDTDQIQDYPTVGHGREFQENDQPTTLSASVVTPTPPCPSIQHTLVIKMPESTLDLSTSRGKTNPSSAALSPAQLSAVVSAVRSTQSRLSSMVSSPGMSSGQKELVAVPISFQSVMRPHHKIIVIPRQSKPPPSQISAQGTAIIHQQKTVPSSGTATFIGKTNANADRTSGEGGTVTSEDQQQANPGTPTDQTPPNTSAVEVEPTLSPPEPTPCKNTVQIKLNRIQLPALVARCETLVENSAEDSPQIEIRKKRGRPRKHPLPASTPQPKECNLPSGTTATLTIMPSETATPLQSSQGEDQPPVVEPANVFQAPSPKNLYPVVAADHSYPQYSMTKSQFLAKLDVSPVIPQPRKTSPIQKERTSLVERLRSHLKPHVKKPRKAQKDETRQAGSNLTAGTTDTLFTTAPSTSSQALQEEELCRSEEVQQREDISVEEQQLEETNQPSVETSRPRKEQNSDQTPAVTSDQLSAGSPKTKKYQRSEGAPRGKKDNPSCETSRPNKAQQSEDSQNKTDPPKTSPSPKKVANKSQVKRKTSSKANVMPPGSSKKRKIQKMKLEESDTDCVHDYDEGLHTGLTPMRNKIINSNALLSCVRKGIKKKSFLCKFCRKEFTKKKDIETHIQVHVGKKPFQCNICHRRFSRTLELSRHLKRHSSDKRFQCTSCGKGFIEYNNLKRHTYIHTGEKPFVCPHCSRSFTQSCHMRAHIKNIHRGVED